MKAPPLARSSTPAAERMSKTPSNKPPGFSTMAPPNPATPVTPRVRNSTSSSGRNSSAASTISSAPKSLHPNVAVARSPSARSRRSGTIVAGSESSRPLSVASVRPTSAAGGRSNSRRGGDAGRESPMFFHASEIQSQPAAGPRVRVRPSTDKLPSSSRSSIGTAPLLVPSNAKHNNISPPTSRPTSMLQPVTPKGSLQNERLSAALEPRNKEVKFVYANGTEEILAPRNASSDADSGTSSPAMPVSPGLSSGNSTTSPSKLGYPFSPLPSPGGGQPTPQQVFQRHASGSSRRGSIDLRRQHSRTVSIGSIGEMFKAPGSEEGLGIQTDDRPLPPPEPAAQTPHVVTQEMEDLAATARRDRRVLDLEISNNSLSAINRTLERELRKQASELRRYKRLYATPAALPIPSDAADPPLPLDTDDISDDEFEDAPLPPAPPTQLPPADDASDSDVSDTENPQQPPKNTTRLGLDLDKHQALLDASVKMNASLKRCQYITDELIREAKRALEYKVGVEDVKLGGRVLGYEESVAGTTDSEAGGPEDEDEDTEDDGDDDGELDGLDGEGGGLGGSGREGVGVPEGPRLAPGLMGGQGWRPWGVQTRHSLF